MAVLPPINPPVSSATTFTVAGGPLLNAGTVTNGGTVSGSVSSLAPHGIILSEGTSAIVATAAMTNGQILIGSTGADPAPQTITGDISINSGGTSAIGSIVAGTTIGAGSIIPVLTINNQGRVTNIGSASVASSGVSSGGGIATVSGSVVSVGTVSALAATNVIITGANTLNATNAAYSNNVIAGGNGNTTGAFAGQAIGGGSSNLTGGTNATVGGGSSNQATNTGAVVPGGRSNVASGSDSFAAGFGNTASGVQSVAQGNGSAAAAPYTFAHGNAVRSDGTASFAVGQFTTTRGTSGAFVRGGMGGPSAAGGFPGRGQGVVYTLFCQTAGATAARLTTDGGAASSANIGILPQTGLALWTVTMFITDKSTFGATATYSIGPSLLLRSAANAMTLGTGNPAAVAGPTNGTLVLAVPPTLTADATLFGFNLSFTPPVGNTDTLYAVAIVEAVETQLN
jgi:hypothetical protein